MATATVPSFAPANSAFLNTGTVSANVAIPSSGSILLVTNTAEYPAYMAIGTTSTLAATINSGTPILPNSQLWLTVGTATTLAAIGEEPGALVLTSGN